MASIISFFKWLFSGRWFRRAKQEAVKKEHFTIENVRDFPDVLEPMKIYLIGKPGDPFFAGLACPCGCGQLIELVIKGDHPRWSVTTSSDGKVTIRPSIWRNINCHSHFFVTDGKVTWCST